ncbi:MAG: AAA family ATPase, partial [Bacteroidota bacterium]
VFGIPLLKLDAGRIFAGLVGQSESNLRSVIQTAEAIAPCVLWLDEIDKGVSGDTIIGNGTKMDNFVQVGHDTHIGKNCLIGSHSAIAGVAVIEDEVILWAKVVINKDIVIGKGAILLATSGADKSLPGGKVYFGAPAMDARKKWREIIALRKLVENHK